MPLSALSHVSPISANSDRGEVVMRDCLTTNYKKRINSRQSGIFTTRVTGLYDAICFLFKKHQLTVQFCYLRLYFGIDIVSRRLLQWVARIENGLKVTKKVTFKQFMAAHA